MERTETLHESLYAIRAGLNAIEHRLFEQDNPEWRAVTALFIPEWDTTIRSEQSERDDASLIVRRARTVVDAAAILAAEAPGGGLRVRICWGGGRTEAWNLSHFVVSWRFGHPGDEALGESDLAELEGFESVR